VRNERTAEWMSTSGRQGGGPGYLYVRLISLHFRFWFICFSRVPFIAPKKQNLCPLSYPLSLLVLSHSFNKNVLTTFVSLRQLSISSPLVPIPPPALAGQVPHAVSAIANALKFMVIDECPASVALSGGEHCKQCRVSEVCLSLTVVSPV
jgi:hypothetical protein